MRDWKFILNLGESLRGKAHAVHICQAISAGVAPRRRGFLWKQGANMLLQHDRRRSSGAAGQFLRELRVVAICTAADAQEPVRTSILLQRIKAPT